MPLGVGGTPRRWALAACVLLLVCVGCRLPTDPGIPLAGPVVAVPADPELAPRVPESVRARGVLRVGTDPSYPPLEYMDSQGRLTGLEVQLVLAVAAILDLRASFRPESFTALEAGVKAGRFDLGAGALTLGPGESFATDSVLYLATGTRLARPLGSTVDLARLCGARVAALEGSLQVAQLSDRSRRCRAAGAAPIVVLTSPSATSVTRRVLTGQADAMVADAAVVQAAVRSYPTELELAPGFYGPTNFALLTRPGQGQDALADLVAAAITSLIEDGLYDKILASFGVTDGGVEQAIVLPAGFPTHDSGGSGEQQDATG